MTIELSADRLKYEFDYKKLNCSSTEELSPLEGIIGQDRAVKALKFGLNIENGGFNIFVAGHPGTGRMTGVKGFVEELAKSKPVPPDWCYVNNFKNSYEPLAIELPAGKGREFAEDIKNMINSIRELLTVTFESKDYGDKKETVTKNIEAKKEKLLQILNDRVKDDGFVLRSTQIGLFIIPARDG
ncbi:MAG: AAA family ATPase, partial [Actinobacteria bacterium]|nr:AAA family ATPase [Actinomycetota bacterium]